jgi:hypothetical protein
MMRNDTRNLGSSTRRGSWTEKIPARRITHSELAGECVPCAQELEIRTQTLTMLSFLAACVPESTLRTGSCTLRFPRSSISSK